MGKKKKLCKRRFGSIDDVIPEGTPVEVVENTMGARVCNVCGSELIEIGAEIHCSLEMKPAEFLVRENRYLTYACNHYEKDAE